MQTRKGKKSNSRSYYSFSDFHNKKRKKKKRRENFPAAFTEVHKINKTKTKKITKPTPKRIVQYINIYK